MSGSDILIPQATGKGRPKDRNVNIGMFGEHEKGKTTFAEERLLANKQRLIIFDTLCKDYGNPEFCKATGINYDAVIDDAFEFKTTLVKLLEKKNKFRLVCRCAGEEQVVLMESFFKFNPVKKRSTLTDTTFLIEEISFYMASSSVDQDETLIAARKFIKDHCQYGRHNRNNMVGVARIPTETTPLYRSQLDIMISFGQSERQVMDFFAKYDVDKAMKLRSLKMGEFEILKGAEEQLARFIAAP